MLNSAAGVQLPFLRPPPMMEILPIFDFNSGCVSNNAATFVCGPVAIIVTGSSLSLNTFAIKPTEDNSDNCMHGSGIAGPSKPDSPWKFPAVINGDNNGSSLPFAIGASIPSKVQIRIALYVVLASVWFPATLVTALISKAGFALANTQAIASS